MSCFYHDKNEDASICPSCGKKLCRECAELVTGGYCYDCALICNTNNKKKMVTNLICSGIMVLMAVVALVLPRYISGNKILEYVCIGLFLVSCVFPGYKFLSDCSKKGNANTVDNRTGGEIAFGFFLKFLIALFMSPVTLLIYIVRTIISVVNYSKYANNLKIITSSFESIQNGEEDQDLSDYE